MSRLLQPLALTLVLLPLKSVQLCQTRGPAECATLLRHLTFPALHKEPSFKLLAIMSWG